MVNQARLDTMQRGALLINTARGGLVVERNLANALNAGRIAGRRSTSCRASRPSPTTPCSAQRTA